MFAWNCVIRCKDTIFLTIMKHIDSTYFYDSALKLNRLCQVSFYDEDILSLYFDVGDGTQDINWFLNFSNWSPVNGFVKISSTCSLVEICSILMVLFTSCDLQWYSLTYKCLVHACVLWLVEISTQVLSSSNTLHITLGAVLRIGKFRDLISDCKFLITIT